MQPTQDGEDTDESLYARVARDYHKAVAGGRFIAHLYGWKEHVYPYERDLADVYALPCNMAADTAGAAPVSGAGAVGGMKMP